MANWKEDWAENWTERSMTFAVVLLLIALALVDYGKANTVRVTTLCKQEEGYAERRENVATCALLTRGQTV